MGKEITIVDGVRHMTKEFIICAAIHVDDRKKHEEQPKGIDTGFIIAGRRHSDCYKTISSMISIIQEKDLITIIQEEDVANDIMHLAPDENQGFITSHNRYVNRHEGYKIAVANNQIWHNLSDKDQMILASEDLYYP